jgi:hypothetical protein
MSDADGAVTLDEFVATAGRWSDKLPENIKAQIMASNAGALKISKWLNQIGYKDATVGKCQTLVTERDKQQTVD